MAASPSKAAIDARIRRLKAKNPGTAWRVLRASNGEVAILQRDDIDVRDDGGSVVLMEPISLRARAWFSFQLPIDAPMLGNSYGIERRYLADIVDGIKAAGYTMRLA